MWKSGTVKHPNDWSPDSKYLIYDDHHATQRQDLWVLPFSGERKPVPFLVTPADETAAQFSPDGKWIAYSSDESGRRQIFVRDFAAGQVPATSGGRWQISTAGGDKPRWSVDGGEIYYLGPDRQLMTVPVKTRPNFQRGSAGPLFPTNVTGFFHMTSQQTGGF